MMNSIIVLIQLFVYLFIFHFKCYSWYLILGNDTNNNRYKSAAATSYPYVHNSNGGAIKRGCEVVDGENEDDFVTMSSSTSSTAGCSRRSPPKKPKFVVTSEEMNEFFKLLHHNKVQQFLKRDSCCLISDKVNIIKINIIKKKIN